jgi:predicted nucleic acid-binding protein
VEGARPLATYVVDASVLIKLFLPEDGSERASELLVDAGPKQRRAVPDLAWVECANVFWKWVRRGLLSADVARQNAADLSRLPLDVWPIEALLPLAMDLALTCGVTVYDATYVALAHHLNCPLVTADVALIRLVAGSGVTVHSLDSAPLASP